MTSERDPPRDNRVEGEPVGADKEPAAAEETADTVPPRKPPAGSVPHGPEKQWSEMGPWANVTCHVRTQSLWAARARKVNCSALLRAALDEVLRGSGIASIEEEIRGPEERMRGLNAAKTDLQRAAKIAAESVAQGAARDHAIKALSEEFSRAGRPGKGRHYNLAWLELRVRDSLELRGTKVEEVLTLVEASLASGAGGPEV